MQQNSAEAHGHHFKLQSGPKRAGEEINSKSSALIVFLLLLHSRLPL